MKGNNREQVTSFGSYHQLLLVGVAGALLLALLARSEAPRNDLPPVAVAELSGAPDVGARAGVEQTLQSLPLYFVENRGQANSRVAFYLQGRDTDIYFTGDGVTFAINERNEAQSSEPHPSPRKRWAVELDFLGSNPTTRPAGEEKTGATMSYFRGGPADWKTEVPTYDRVAYRELWPGVDLVYTGTEGHLKYSFTVAPGADPSRIRLAYRGASSVQVTEEGRLAVATPVGGFEDDRPYAYQEFDGEQVEVSAAYVLEDRDESGAHRYSFHVGPYDETKPLILDPVFLTYTGYIGGSSTDSANNVAVDGSGNAYVTGWTISTASSFPETVGPDLTHNGGTYDVFVAKVTADGTGLDYCGYIGGSGADFGNRIAVDSSGNAYVGGTTTSTTGFPVTVGPDLTYGGNTDVFIAKVNATGSALVYCGYVGGSLEDNGGGVAVDSSGNAYVTGKTASTQTDGFPLSAGPFLTHSGGTYDAFVVKVSSDGSSFVYSGYIGGSGDDDGRDVTVTGFDAVVVGVTSSTETDFPVSVGPDLTANGGNDVFIARVDAAGTSLTYSGFIGGSLAEDSYGVAVDGSGNAYISGRTASTESDGFPVTVGPDLTYNGGSRDVFVAKVKADGTALDYCGYIGGSGTEVVANDIAVDSSGNAYTMGYTSSTEASFPVIRGPDSTFNGSTYDAFVAKILADGTGFSYCGYIGGSSNDFANGIAVDSSGSAYVVGQTGSDQTTFPVHVGPDLTFNGAPGDNDGWIAKIEDTGGTAVELAAFRAEGLDGSVRVEWETASELDNLGFHLYRSLSETGPYERITDSLIPGLGSSPEGARYHYLDSGLVNGTTYFYELEDVETTGSSELHGPVSAAPAAGVRAAEESNDTAPARLIYGDPSAVSMRVVERTSRGMVLELDTGGFFADPLDDGSVEITVPGIWSESQEGSAAIPTWRSWLQVPPAASVRIASVEEKDVEEFSSLQPALAEASKMVATPQGVVRLERRRVGGKRASSRAVPAYETARVVSVGYQGEVQKALVELAPLRWDSARGRLLLARRLVVRLSFSGRNGQEESKDARARRRAVETRGHRQQNLLARLRVRDEGVYAVAFEELTGSRRLLLPKSSLGLSRLGQAVPFHLEPEGAPFGPGSKLYFFSEGEALNPHGDAAVYELVRTEGEPMAVHSASPRGEPVEFYWQRVSREENRYYQAALLEAPDLWLWDVLLAPDRKSYSFEVSELASSGTRSATLEVVLQGVSDLSPSSDHHIRAYLNGVWLADTVFAGKRTEILNVRFPSELLRDGENALEIENVGDMGVAYSMVMLDRFALSYPRRLRAMHGAWQGSFSRAGVVELSGLAEGALVLDVTDEPIWLRAGVSRFYVEAGRTYRAVDARSLLRPTIERPRASGLTSPRNRADYLILGPREFLPAAEPLLDWRRRQGLRGQMVSIEDVYSEFGFGEARPEAVREFLSYAYHHWQQPALRYVLLLGDATYDFKDYLRTGVKNQVPPWMVRTSFLWTASDARYAAVHGDDLLPDLAIGRLPAASTGEVQALVEKILDYETSVSVAEAPVVLVADNPDSAGDFVGRAEDLASGLLAEHHPEKIYLDRLGTEAARAAIGDAFDRGASLLSYVGHGGIHLWAEENLLDTARVASLAPQPRQPVVLTLNCLNGYFHFPYFNSLSEALIKAADKGAIAAISPSGLSLDAPAHLFHRALVGELLSARHPRLGDAFLAAQADYAESGAFPELLSIYHLLGDPALRIR